jgi:hypothetical protein
MEDKLKLLQTADSALCHCAEQLIELVKNSDVEDKPMMQKILKQVFRIHFKLDYIYLHNGGKKNET